MPALDSKTISDLTERLHRYLAASGETCDVTYLDAGGSAAVFRVKRGDCVRAIKVFDPVLFNGQGASADRRRLSVQYSLIGHTCKSLIQTYRAEEGEGTAFIEMEFIDWPQLAKCLGQIPDEAVIPLIGQLVDAVRYLESLNIVHRDIKPENIHVSPDYLQLKLLDLGVAREFDCSEGSDVAVTDDGQRRPFLATAQYSSPEYLFRLDEPTEKLWRGLNIYQVGAVLHDLVKKEAIFLHEVSLGNRWLVARAVLTKRPSFSDSDFGRLTSAKVLALKCLGKDLDTRLTLVRWEDFQFGESSDHILDLQKRLSCKSISKDTTLSVEKLTFDKAEYLRRVFGKVRAELISVCGTQLPVSMHPLSSNETSEVKFRFEHQSSCAIECVIKLHWRHGLYQRTAAVHIGAIILGGQKIISSSDVECALLFEIDIDDGDGGSVDVISKNIAKIIMLALDKIEAAGDMALELDGTLII